MSTRNGGYERLPMYALSESAPRLRSSSSFNSLRSPSNRTSHASPPTLDHEPRRWNLGSGSSPTKSRHSYFNAVRPRTVFNVLKFGLPAAAALLLLGLFLYEPHIELAFYSRDWIRKEIMPVEPLLGCFDAARVSPEYNVSDALFGPRRVDVHAGMPLRLGMDCYNFAGTVRDPDPKPEPAPHLKPHHDPLPEAQRTHFHTYWRTNLAPFGTRQEYMLKSFVATQDLATSRFVLWSDGDLSGNAVLQKYLRRFPHVFVLRIAKIPELAKGTPLEGHEVLRVKDEKAWVDGDLVRLLVVWAYGGVWVDMDTLLTRDLHPLLEHEFVTQWDCYDKIYQPLNGALMHFRKHSPYLCEAFHIMATSPAPRKGSTDWGALLYLKLWRRLVAASVPPFKVLPFCFSDARSCRLDNRLPDPFVADGKGRGPWPVAELAHGGGLDVTLRKIFSVHLHNQWEKDFPEDGWVRRLIIGKHEKLLDSNRIKDERGVGDEL